ncbi:MAG: hypothetical protein CVT49_05640 [candidate division Zixibacteria bacterium HGW-Zixibacteria-1]|nr:MAG: hypothetical protein CVT49_05640 [candidate division Zixibacteria bacterium HGW-Zixibacteria-1]
MLNAKLHQCILCTLILLTIVISLSAEVPQFINYQGRLTDPGGDPVADGPYLIKFKIYGSEAGNDSLWSSGFQAVTVSNGLFSYKLGTSVPLPADIFGPGSDPFLGITIGTDAEVTPRTAITSAAFAWHANSSDTSQFATTVTDGSITNAKLATDAVTQEKIDDNSIHSAHIQNHSILLEDLNQNGATTNQIIRWDGSAWVVSDDAAGSGDITGVTAGSGLTGGGSSGDVTISVGSNAINSSHIGTAAVGWDEIANSVITSEKINNNAVTTAKIADFAVTTGKIAYNSIVGNHIVTNAVGSDAIADNAVGSSEIANFAVTTGKIAYNSIVGSHIVTNAVGSDAIADGAITSGKIYTGAVTDVKIASNAVTTAKIANSSVTSDKIVSDAVTAVKIAADAVGISEITTSAVGSDEIVDNSITNLDINTMADIATTKIYGTAVNFSSTQSIWGNKTFHDFHLGDSVLTADDVGIVIGTVTETAPSYTNLLNVSRHFSTSSVRNGINCAIVNPSTGTLFAVRGQCTGEGDRYGVYGYVTSWGVNQSGAAYGVYGASSYGVNGYGGYFSATNATNKYGVYGSCGVSNGNYGAYFYGNVDITGGYTKASGAFKIDHPQDPENMYLMHADVSSPEMKNVYDGVAELDANGEATVEMPSYFESLNESYRYQLTPIGSPMPDLYVSQKVKDNHFMISGGKPFMEVSWQVTGIRKDAFAKSQSFEVESTKVANERGLYQNPELFGYGIEKAVDYENHKIKPQEITAETEE